MKDLKITKGKYSLYKGKKNLFISTPEWLQFIKIYVTKSFKIEAESNASLILDTFETANKCNLLPSELLDQRDELLANLKRLVDRIQECNYHNDFPSAFERAQNAIKKAQ